MLIPYFLVFGLGAFLITLVFRRVLRRLSFYRLVWHAGLFDVALFVVLLWVTSIVTSTWNTAGVK